jgi:hypothetical protein
MSEGSQGLEIKSTFVAQEGEPLNPHTAPKKHPALDALAAMTFQNKQETMPDPLKAFTSAHPEQPPDWYQSQKIVKDFAVKGHARSAVARLIHYGWIKSYDQIGQVPDETLLSLGMGKKSLDELRRVYPLTSKPE